MRHTLGSSIGYFRELTSDPRPDDQEWRAEIERELDIWRSLYESAQSTSPPEGFEEIHDRITSGLGELVSAADLIEIYLQDGASELLDDARALIDAGLDLIWDGLERIEETTDPK